jgi:hypothetical protein
MALSPLPTEPGPLSGGLLRTWGTVALLVVGIVLAAAVTFSLLRAQNVVPASTPPPSPGVGVARIFAGAASAPFAVEVQNVQRPSDGAGLVVRMLATFSNRGRASYRADPDDFHLQDARGDQWQVSFDPARDCAAWPVTPVQPNADFGPVPLCFRTASSPQDPLEVTWDPDVSFVLFSGPAVVIRLP